MYISIISVRLTKKRNYYSIHIYLYGAFHNKHHFLAALERMSQHYNYN